MGGTGGSTLDDMSNVPTPFSEAATYYSFRAPYAPAAFDFISDALGLNAQSQVLDLGCGPGTLTLPLSRRAGHVVAVDPCQEMIDEGLRRAADAGYHNIEWHCARAEDYCRNSKRQFVLATIGQAFHWMDRDGVLQCLSRLLGPSHGALVLVNPGRRQPQESWEPIANEVIARYLGKRSRHPDMHPEPKHEPALLRSEFFADFIAREFSTCVERDIRSIIGHTYSLSSSPRSSFGARAPEFEAELTKALLSLNPTGRFIERVDTEVMLARRRNQDTGRSESLAP